MTMRCLRRLGSWPRSSAKIAPAPVWPLPCDRKTSNSSASSTSRGEDRFGRFDSIEVGEWVSPLRRVGVELVTVCQGRIDWNDFAGRLIYQITLEGKHRFLVDLSHNALRGMIRFARQEHLLGMATPYGYDRLYINAVWPPISALAEVEILVRSC